MRCKNCGWENPDGQTKCEKCHADLADTSSSHKDTAPVSERLRSTVAEDVGFMESIANSTPKTCPKCGYPISNNSNNCPNCDYELRTNATNKQFVTCKSCGAEIAPNAKFCSSCGVPINENNSQHHRIQRSGIGTIMSKNLINKINAFRQSTGYTSKVRILKNILFQKTNRIFSDKFRQKQFRLSRSYDTSTSTGL